MARLGLEQTQINLSCGSDWLLEVRTGLIAFAALTLPYPASGDPVGLLSQCGHQPCRPINALAGSPVVCNKSKHKTNKPRSILGTTQIYLRLVSDYA